MNKFNKLIKSINSRFGKFNNNELENVLNVLNNNKKLDYVKKLEGFFQKNLRSNIQLRVIQALQDYILL